MSITIGSNIDGVALSRRLNAGSERLATSFERLSSGLRINHAGDDPAALALSSGLRAESRVLARAVLNVSDGISFLNVASGALQELSNILYRQAELAEQAANGLYALEQRRALNVEVNALVEEFNRIVETTEFNGRQLLHTPRQTIGIQAGSGYEATIDFNLASALPRTVGSGSFGGQVTYATVGRSISLVSGDFNGDGLFDVAAGDYSLDRVQILLGNGDGTLRAATYFRGGDGPYAVAGADVDGDSITDLISADALGGTISVLLGNGNGTFAIPLSFAAGTSPVSVALANFNGDQSLDIVIADSGGAAAVLLGNGDGSFNAPSSYSVGGGPWQVDVGDFNNDGKTDFVTASSTDNAVRVVFGNGDGMFRVGSPAAVGNTPYVVRAGDLNGDGNLDLIAANYAADTMSVLLGNGDGGFAAQAVFGAGDEPCALDLGDINGDGRLDAVLGNKDDSVTLLLNKGDGTFEASRSFASGNVLFAVELADLNGDNALDILSGDWNWGVNVLLADTTSVTTMPFLSLLSREEALAAFRTVDDTLSRVTSELGSIGASQSRFEHTIAYLQVARENLLAADSRIVDADVAQEAAELVRQQVLQQAGTAIIAQANQQTAAVLSLLLGIP